MTGTDSKMHNQNDPGGSSIAEKLRSFLRASQSKLSLNILFFSAILLIGIFARTWEFSSLPPGLYPDEASSGVDAFSLLHFGVDRHGMSFPILFVPWGGGQNALYAYMMIPFIAIGGLSPLTVRLPMLISGILTLPLAYFIGKRTMDEKLGLAAMFFLAISPWHILLSRWGLESNILPFVFSIGYLLLLKSLEKPIWFIPAMMFMGLCLYAYGTAYAAIPLFLLCAIPTLLLAKKINSKILIQGLITLFIVSAPIGLFLLINSRHWESVHIGSITIPRLPATPRYESISVVFKNNLLPNMLQNFQNLIRLLWLQVDGDVFNSVAPYGYFYAYTLPLEVLGAALWMWMPKGATLENIIKRILLLAWLVVGLILGTLQSLNINHINLVFIPLLFCVAMVAVWIAEHSKTGLVIMFALFSLAFVLFTHDYHSSEYRSQADGEFNTGLIQAIDFASQQDDHPICIAKDINGAYIYVLFSQQMNPWSYQQTIKYANPPNAEFEQVRYLGRYGFGFKDCSKSADTIYILSSETPPEGNVTYHVTAFSRFKVYSPIINSGGAKKTGQTEIELGNGMSKLCGKDQAT